MFFQPSRDEVRRFFQTSWQKARQQQACSPLEVLANEWIAEHPEYHALLDQPEAMLQDFSVEAGQTNPFLHLSMHLSLSEQVSIDQPPGVRQLIEDLAEQTGSLHEAMHQAMDCLGEMLWTAQRNGQAPDAQHYLDCLRRQASR